MPPSIHDKRSGGPNWRLPDRVETFWRMAAEVRQLARRTPRGTQFVALCDCNVHFGRDRSDHLVRGRLTDRSGWTATTPPDVVLAPAGRSTT